MKTPVTALGRWMRQRRSELELTARDAAERVGWSQQRWSAIESGYRRRTEGHPEEVRRATLDAIAEALESCREDVYRVAGAIPDEMVTAEHSAARVAAGLETVLDRLPPHKRRAFEDAVIRAVEDLASIATT